MYLYISEAGSLLKVFERNLSSLCPASLRVIFSVSMSAPAAPRRPDLLKLYEERAT
jgi:hypothetical protein